MIFGRIWAALSPPYLQCKSCRWQVDLRSPSKELDRECRNNEPGITNTARMLAETLMILYGRPSTINGQKNVVG
jgi:hypothetical protein